MLKKRKNRQKKQGAFTFVEVLVAVTIVALVMTALGSMMALSVRVAEANEMEQLAQMKAQQSIEFFRRERLVRGWNIFSDNLTNSTYCLNTLPDTIVSLTTGPCSSPQTDFNFFYYNIEANIINNSTDQIDVQIDIYRYDKSGNEIYPGVAFYTVNQTFKQY